jgi:hypothetical protein
MNTIALLLLLSAAPFPIITVESPRIDPTPTTYFPEVFNAAVHPPSKLLRVALDGAQDYLLAGGTDALMDPVMSLDGKWVFFTHLRQIPNGYGQMKPQSDIYRIRLSDKKVVRLTEQNWEAPAMVTNPNADYPYQSVCNMHPCHHPSGKLVFVSNRGGYGPPKGFTAPGLRLYVMDDDLSETPGESRRNVTCIGHLNVSSAMHPVLMTNGDIMFSSHESQGLRDEIQWGLWKIKVDGRAWGPIFSAFNYGASFHFHTQLSDSTIVSNIYYIQNNFGGFGSCVGAPLDTTPGLPAFLSPNPLDNPPIGMLAGDVGWRFSTMRRDMYAVTPNMPATDVASSQGKVNHPKGAPGNTLLCTYSPGGVNALAGQYPHCKVGLIRKKVAESPADIEILLEHPDRHYSQPIAAVPWVDIYGSLPPVEEFLPNTSGTPFGILEVSSAHIGQYKEYTPTPAGLGDTLIQGFDSGHPDEVPAGIDIIRLEPVLATTYPPTDAGWNNRGHERERLLARIYFNEADRPAGDTSFRVKIPADQPWTFRTFAADGRTIAKAGTWHQVRPGEKMHCGGCHNHSGQYVPFEGTYAAVKQLLVDFRDQTERTPEFNRDVKPIIDAKCASCHNESHPVKLDASLATSIYVRPYKAFSSRLSKAIHGEGTTVQMPKDAPPLIAADMLKIDEWIDFGCLVATPEAADRDLTPPTLYVPRAGLLKIGAWGDTSLTATLNGNPLTLPAAVDGVHDTGHAMQAGDLIVVTATDAAGNKTTVERFVTQTVAPVDETEQLRQELAALKAMIRTYLLELDAITSPLRGVSDSLNPQ